MGNIYTSAIGMIAYQNQLSVIGNNIANADSDGYKSDDATFKTFDEGLRQMLSADKTGVIGPYQDEVEMDDAVTNFTPGTLEVTNNPMDVALENEPDQSGNKNVSFFEVQANGQTLLTRDGHFQLDNQGNLSLINGAYVLDTNGKPIQIPPNTKISIDSTGHILDQKTGNIIDQIQIRTVGEQNTGYLKKVNGNMFQVMSLNEIQQYFGPINSILSAFSVNPSLQKILKNPAVLQQATSTGQINIFSPNTNVTLQQNTLEKSNVDISSELEKMMEAQRGIEANSKAEMTMDKINDKDANQIGV